MLPPQLSVAVGAVHVAVCLQFVLPASVCTVMLDGQPLIAGGVLSFTVTANWQLCPVDGDDTVTIVVPTGKNEPDAWL